MTAVVLRLAGPGDAAALARLAALDSAAVPPGPVLLTEVDGELWAARGLDGAEVVAESVPALRATRAPARRARAAACGAAQSRGLRWAWAQPPAGARRWGW
ncbi:MAG: hypothetical protein M3P39_05385 [Actinomycetota bacterium]|nr:hypothetical protein [Actinomycetota bacterium]